MEDLGVELMSSQITRQKIPMKLDHTTAKRLIDVLINKKPEDRVQNEIAPLIQIV